MSVQRTGAQKLTCKLSATAQQSPLAYYLYQSGQLGIVAGAQHLTSEDFIARLVLHIRHLTEQTRAQL